MDHGGEVPRPTAAADSTDDHGMAVVVRGGDADRSTGTFQPTEAAYPNNSAELVRHVRAASGGAVPVAVSHRERGPGVVYANIGASAWRQLGPLDVVLVDPQLIPGGVVPVHHNYGYSALQPEPRLAAGHGVVHNGDYMLLPSPGAGVVHSNCMLWQPSQAAGHGELFVGLLPDGAGHGEVFVGLLPDVAGHVEAFVGQLPRGSGAVYGGDYGYFTLQPRPGDGHGEVVVDDLIPDGAGHREVFLDLLLVGGNAVRDDYGVDMEYGDPGMPATHVRRLLAFIGIGASSVAVNGLAAGPGSPPVAFHLFVLLLAGLFLVILHVLRV